MTNEKLYQLGPDDEIFPLMIYSAQYIAWGEAITKKTIRFLKLVRTPMCPAYVVLYQAKILVSGALQPMAFPVFHISTADILGIHPMPPNQEPYDYDTKEANRKMEPVTVLMGTFRMDGKMRISTHSNITQMLEAAKEPYLAVYDATITSLASNKHKALHTQVAAVRRSNIFIAAYSTEKESGI